MGILVGIGIIVLVISFLKDKKIYEISDLIVLLITVLMGSCISVLNMIIERCSEENLKVRYRKKAIKKFLLNEDFFDEVEE